MGLGVPKGIARRSSVDAPARVLEHAFEAYIATDARGVITEWNAAAVRTFGWTRSEAVGRDLVELIVPADHREAHLQGMRRYLSHRHPGARRRRLELDAIDREGRAIPVEISISALTGADGETSFHALLHDISDRVNATSAERLAAIVEGSADAILATTQTGEIIDWNPAAERLFGWPRSAILGLPVSVLVPPHLRAESDELWRGVLGGTPVIAHETERVRRDGTLVEVELTLSRLAGCGGADCCSATYRDIGARRRAERELTAHRDRLRRLADAELDRASRPGRLDTPPAPDAGRGSEICDRLVALAREHLGMDLVCLQQVSETAMQVRSLAGDGASFGVANGDSIPREETLCGQMLAGEIPARIPDIRSHSVAAGLPATRARGVGAYLGVEVRLQDGRLYGTLCAASHRPEPTLGERELAFLEVLAGMLAEHVDHSEHVASSHRAESEVTAVEALLAALDARDRYTGEHSKAVVDLSTAVARQLQLDAEAVVSVGQVALLHDLGKVGIPDSILQKAGPLSDAEWELMREHPAIGARIVATIDPLAHLAAAIRAEHERWDGGGYPDGLASTDIPIAARITFSCDAYHAMVSDRPYRRALGHDAARAELRRNARTQFDPDVVDALLAVVGD